MNTLSGSDAAAGKSPLHDEDGELVVREARAEDSQAIRDLFSRIFDDRMTAEHWRWKYARPQSRAIVVYRDAQLVAHYGGVGQHILADGADSTAIQITDLMVDPAARHAVRNRSPFYQSARKFLESYVGTGKPFLYAYGFPSDRAMKLSERLGLYAPVGRIREMTWQLDTQQAKPDLAVVEVDRENFPAVKDKIDALWQKFRGRFSGHFTVVKDADYIRWRYLEHPSRQYTVYLLTSKFLRRPRELIVFRQDRNMLMDVLTTSPGFDTVIDHACQVAAANGAKQLMTWCTDAFCRDFRVFSPGEKDLPIIIPANICSEGPAPQTQESKWYLMPGDTDYL